MTNATSQPIIGHTPTPWKVSIGSTHIPGVCKFESIHGMYSNHEANAAFIVEAANNYESLKARVAELEALMHSARKHLKTAWTYAGLDSPVLETYLRLVDAALNPEKPMD